MQNIISYIKNNVSSLSRTIEKIDISYKELLTLPKLSKLIILKELNCSHNQITSLPSLPANLLDLNCSDNELTSLPYLPAKLVILFCNNQLIISKGFIVRN